MYAWKFLEKILPARLFLSLYPPLLGAGIRVLSVSRDFRHIRVLLKKSFLRRNIMGVHFGGSLYSMTDPFYMYLLMKNLGPGYRIWDTSARIQFRKAVSSPVFAEFLLEPETIQTIQILAEDGGRHYHTFFVSIQTDEGVEVATVEKEIYVRKRNENSRGSSQVRK